MTPEQHRFHNALRILSNTDHCDLCDLTDGKWIKFQRDPFRYFITASDHQKDLIWALIESRQPKPEIGVGVGATVHATVCAYTSNLAFKHRTPIQAAAHCERLKAAVESGVFRLTVDPSAEYRERMVKMLECR